MSDWDALGLAIVRDLQMVFLKSGDSGVRSHDGVDALNVHRVS